MNKIFSDIGCSVIMLLTIVGVIFLICYTNDVANCGDIQYEKTTIVRVAMHESHYYTVFVLDGTNLNEIKVEANLIQDLKPEEPMYVIRPYQYGKGMRTGEIKKYYVSSGIKKCEIHIHSSDELIGGSWNHGKFGSGMTTIIEQ